MSGRAPEVLMQPVAVSTAYVVPIVVYSDWIRKTRQDISGKTITVLVRDQGGTTRSYEATIDVAASGEAHITLNASWHTSVGDADVQVHVDGMMRPPRFALPFVEKLTSA